MSNLAEQMIRPRIVSIYTRDSPDHLEEGNIRVNFPEPISALDGFNLVAGLRSFGFVSDCYNISERQSNNRFLIRCTYQQAPLIYNPAAVDYDPQGDFVESGRKKFLYDENGIAFTDKYIIEYERVIPDGLYQTRKELYQVLNETLFDPITAGYVENNFTNKQFFANQSNALILFKETNYGFSLIPQVSDISVLSTWSDGQGGPFYYAHQTMDKILSIEITYKEQYEKLWILLFENQAKQSDSISLPTEKKGYLNTNTPQSIRFDFLNVKSTEDYFDDQGVLIVGLQVPQVVNPFAEYSWDTSEYPNVAHINTADGNYQFPFNTTKGLPWYAFQFPIINPQYLDIYCPTLGGSVPNYDSFNGANGSLLYRHFLVGADEGIESQYIQITNPIWVTLDSRDYIPSIEFNVFAEEQMWFFYKKSFYFEIIFFEIPNESQMQSLTTFVPPSDNDINAYIQAKKVAPTFIGDSSGVVLFSERKKKRYSS